MPSHRYNFFFLAVLFLLSCKTSEKVILSHEIRPKGARYLINQVDKHRFQYDWLQIKYSVTANLNGKEHSFKCNVRVRRDSALWASVTPALGIEVARLLLLPDSVKMINRLNSSYFIKSYDEVYQWLGTDLNLANTQNMLTGNQLDINESDDKFYSSVREGMYYLSSDKIKKNPKKAGKVLRSYTHKEKIWIDPVTFRITKQIIEEADDEQRIEVKYSNFRDNDSTFFPYQSEIAIYQKDLQMSLNLKCLKVTVKGPHKFIFDIPEKYERAF